MKILDPGHDYELNTFDAITPRGLTHPPLRFMKRKGPKYPGNDSHYPGTNLQEVFRVCIDRLRYLDNQEHHESNGIIIYELRMAIWLLEMRAAERHKRQLAPNSFDDIEKQPTCPNCGHVQCESDCV